MLTVLIGLVALILFAVNGHVDPMWIRLLVPAIIIDLLVGIAVG